MRYIVLVIALLISGAFMVVNWSAINQTTTVDLFFTKGEAPLSLMLVIIFGILILILLTTLVLQQGSALLGYRRMIRDLEAQKKLASNAENSRLELVKKEFDAKMLEMNQQRQQDNENLQARLDESAQKQLESLTQVIREIKESNQELSLSVDRSLQTMDDKVTKALIAANQVAQVVGMQSRALPKDITSENE
ncbi:MAG: DUF1049 domain-containing protein [Burkholderiaceae bacterium]|nr:DUF1049 domain-containing protein [Burkholderiaceae bacterium]